MKDCIFCKIPAQESEKLLFKDDACYVIYDKYPIEKGHMLVISLQHYENLLEVPEDISAKMIAVAKRFGKSALEEFKATGINIVANNGRDANQIIMHAHIHVLPRYPNTSGKPHYKIAGAKE
ncbi:MAG: HIT domain-containing protein [Candidatus Micrarchaeota archaeon]|nr:HIT domain-containing protein [Candidatus Micrarchaeota archaeon]